ncbi:FAD-dependent oxidoreductase [Anaerocolumna sp. MB42-C2]|uniref:FAD-dependent oxidoreductase n=1 Tax=Anaerocolumna sp. MB42-C2 TaxID=3070997 RepID=UPI002ED1EA73
MNSDNSRIENHNMESIWQKECRFEKREQLKKDINADVVIIGAGMAGLLTAVLLKEKGIEAVVLEANEIASGQTQNTTAKITSQHALIYDYLLQKFGREKAQQYGRANEAAIQMYADLIKEYNISCHFERLPSYVYTKEDVSKIEKEVRAAEQCGIKAEFTTNTTLSFTIKGAVRFNNQAMFNPLEFLKEVVKPLKIYEHTMVKGIEDMVVLTEGGKVKAKEIVVATHYPFINSPGYYFIRMHQERSYAIAISNAPKLDGMYKDESQSGYSFRNYKDMIILGGGSHRTGENSSGRKYENLRKTAREYYPESKEVCHWSAQDCHSVDKIPYIGNYSASTPNLYVATGFNKWGMTNSMVSAMILSDKISGNKNSYEEVFDPQRFQVNASMSGLLDETKHTVNNLIVKKLKIPETKLDEVRNGHGALIEEDGHKVGVYKDEDGKVFMVLAKCTHLGCQLEWNPDELCWECPCHGSRFDFTGVLINNPALESLEHETFN